MMYPLAEFDGKMKTRAIGAALPKFPAQAAGRSGNQVGGAGEDSSTSCLLVLKDAPPLPGEEARYAQVLAVLAAAQKRSGAERR